MVVVILVELWFKVEVDKVEYVKYLEDCLTLTRHMSNANSLSILSLLHFDKHILLKNHCSQRAHLHLSGYVYIPPPKPQGNLPAPHLLHHFSSSSALPCPWG